MATTKARGFYGNATDTYYVAPSGRIWNIQSEDDLGTQDPVEQSTLPGDVQDVGELMDVAEMVEHLERIEAVSGERLLED